VKTFTRTEKGWQKRGVRPSRKLENYVRNRNQRREKRRKEKVVGNLAKEADDLRHVVGRVAVVEIGMMMTMIEI
tara:strand:+ start:191 stop:412 length:222 start_codon:yes stop_codon:yes gene_type:complete